VSATADALRAALDVLEGREGALPAPFVADMLRKALGSVRPNRRGMPRARQFHREADEAGRGTWRLPGPAPRPWRAARAWPAEQERAFGVAFLREWLTVRELPGEEARAALAEHARRWGHVASVAGEAPRRP
jgi:hypothetical protein